jgi:hypothetical protein
VTRVDSEAARREILEIRHSSLYAPRDFDISPYFELVKPTVRNGFDYRAMRWADLPVVDENDIATVPPAVDDQDALPMSPQATA